MAISGCHSHAAGKQLSALELCVIIPVEQPGLLSAGQGGAQLFCLTSNGGVPELPKSIIPLCNASCCDAITVNSGAQVGVDPEKSRHIVTFSIGLMNLQRGCFICVKGNKLHRDDEFTHV